MTMPKKSSYRQRMESENTAENGNYTPIISYKIMIFLAVMGGGCIGAFITTTLGLCKNQRGWENDKYLMVILPVSVAILWVLAFVYTKGTDKIFLGLNHNGWKYAFPILSAIFAVCGFFLAKNL